MKSKSSKIDKQSDAVEENKGRDRRKVTRPGPDTRQDWHHRFIAELLKFPNVSAACRVCGVGRSTAKRHKAQFPEFSEAWDDARAHAADLLEQACIQRATSGTLRPVYQGGVKVGEVREHSDSLAAFLLKGLKAETYGDRSKVELSGKVALSDEEIVARGERAEANFISTLRAAAVTGKTPPNT